MKALVKISLITFILLATNISFFIFTDDTASAQTRSSYDLQKTYFWMKDGYKLSPEAPDPNDFRVTVDCPPKMEPFYPYLPGKYVMQYVWQTLPVNFETLSVNSPVNLGDHIDLKLWFWSTVEELPDVEFRFTVLHNDYIIGRSSNIGRHSLFVGEEDYVEASINLDYSGLSLEVGDHLSLMIEYYVNGDGLQIVFDDIYYDSGFYLDADPIKILDMRASPNTLKAYFNDAFNVNVNTLCFIAEIGSEELYEQCEFAQDSEGIFAYWDVNLQMQTYTVTIKASYGSTHEEYMVEERQTVTVTEKEEPPPPPPDTEPPDTEPPPPPPPDTEPPDTEPPDTEPPDTEPPDDHGDTSGDSGTTDSTSTMSGQDDKAVEGNKVKNTVYLIMIFVTVIILIIAFLALNRRPEFVEE